MSVNILSAQLCWNASRSTANSPPRSKTGHTAHTTPNSRIKLLNAQTINQLPLRPDHIPDTQHRKVRAIRTPISSRLRRTRPCTPITPAQDIRAYHEILVRVERFTRANKLVPPPRRGVRVRRSSMRRCAQPGMQQDSIGFRSVQRAPRLVCEVELGQGRLCRVGEREGPSVVEELVALRGRARVRRFRPGFRRIGGRCVGEERVAGFLRFTRCRE